MGAVLLHDVTGKAVPEPGPRRHGDVNLATLLSLQLLLLAFFVLLTALSSFEGDRSRLVIDSLQSAFSAPFGDRAPTAGGRADALLLLSLQEEVGDLVATAVPLTRVERTAPGRAMSLDLPEDAFFRAGEVRLNPLQRPLFERLVRALDRRPAAYRYEIDLLQPDSVPQPLLVARAGALVDALIAAGAPPASLSIGSRPGEPGRIRIMIRLFGRDAPAGLFDGLADK